RFEGRNLGPLRQPTGFDRFAQRLPLFLAQARCCDLNLPFRVHSCRPHKPEAARRVATSSLCVDLQAISFVSPSRSSTFASNPISASPLFGEPILLRTSVAWLRGAYLICCLQLVRVVTISASSLSDVRFPVPTL